MFWVDIRHTVRYALNMKIFGWNYEKNRKLKRERGVSFEEVVFCIEQGQVLDVLEHPNQNRYKGQRIYVVGINDYAYIVPFVDVGEERFLITIFPSRKYTKIYFDKEVD
ncbi:MAG: toxin [Pseudomonadota bacterium]